MPQHVEWNSPPTGMLLKRSTASSVCMKTLDAIADKVREYAPSRLTTCEVMTRRKDSRQCEARGLKQDHNYER